MIILEDNVALQIVEKNIKHNGQGYVVAIPWKKHPRKHLLIK